MTSNLFYIEYNKFNKTFNRNISKIAIAAMQTQNHLSMKVGSSHGRCSIKEGVLKNFAKFTGKHLCQSLFLIKLKKRRWYKCFAVNFARFSRTPFLQNISG